MNIPTPTAERLVILLSAALLLALAAHLDCLAIALPIP